jgi:glycosyltransferase involved in cell wall biosynthesis
MRILAWPDASGQNDNPYVALLHAELAAKGHKIERLSRRGLLTRPDVIHIHWPEQLVRTQSAASLVSDAVKLLLLLALARRRGAVLVWTAHNLRPHEQRRRRLMDAYLTVFVALVDVVIGMTDRSRTLLVARYPLLKRKPFIVVPHGHYRDVYTALGDRDKTACRRRVGLDPQRRTLLTLGQIRPYKNAPALVRAFVAGASHDAQLAVVGGVSSGALRTELEAARNCDERVHLRLSAVDPEELATWHAAADVVVLAYDTASSLNSGAALLALSLDRPVIMPDGPSAVALRAQVGSDWVTPVSGPASAFVAAALATPAPPSARPDLDHLGWQTVADQTAAAYALARERRGHRSRRRR